MKKVLLIAYHFPPIRSSSGIQRTLSMTRYLRENGWEPIVLSVSPKAYAAVNDAQLNDIPEGILVKRAFARDTARHFTIGGWYPGLLALPDRWISWFPSAVIAGHRLIKSEKPDLIWSTFPIATAHLIGLSLSRMSGLPWVADCRDSMTEDNYPTDKKRWRAFRWLESKAVKYASKVVFTTPSTKRMYEQRYPAVPDGKFTVIANGYDEHIFQTAEALPAKAADVLGPLKLVHSGILYPSERDPTHFFDAIAELKSSGEVDAQKLRVVLRATGHDEKYKPMLRDRKIEDIIELAPGVSYQEALREMLCADALLLFQAANCNHQIPAKVYEYFRSGKPIIALTDEKGDTAETLKDGGISSIFAIDDMEDIKRGLLEFIGKPEATQGKVALQAVAQRYSRKSLTQYYAKQFDAIISAD